MTEIEKLQKRLKKAEKLQEEYMKRNFNGPNGKTLLAMFSDMLPVFSHEGVPPKNAANRFAEMLYGEVLALEDALGYEEVNQNCWSDPERAVQKIKEEYINSIDNV